MIYKIYTSIYQPNIVLASDYNEEYLYIPTGSNFNDVLDILNQKGLLINTESFKWLSKTKNYTENIKPGRYKINRELNNNDLINLLRSGNQKPINLTFNNVRRIEDLAGKISRQIEADSTKIMSILHDTVFLNNNNLNQNNAACIFIPNTYEFYWNTNANDFVNKMLNEYKFFWNKKRLNKAKDIGLSIIEISTLASIVEKEQNIKKDEQPMIAKLYLNRLKKGMKLESDPTLVFALNDFTIKRVLNKDKKIKSKYNTYMYKGLPPGPICIPSISAIDAVLNPIEHNYLFMCAKEDFSGYHNFARTYAKHLINARKYQKELNKRKIMR